MAFADSPDDQALRKAWIDFCSKLQAAGEQVFKDYNPANPLQRADGFRFLTQNLGQAFDLGLETKDTQYPVIHAFCGPFRKLGSDCADFIYQQAWIDGQSAYKISGSRGTARFFNITVQGARPEKIPGTDAPSLHDPFGDIPEANLFGHQLVTEWDGSFEIYVGGAKRGANWLPTTPASRKLFIRQGFDRWDEQPARMRIERIDMTEPKPLPSPATMIAAMDWAAHFVDGLMHDWPDHQYQYSSLSTNPAKPNVFPELVPPDLSDTRRGRAAASMFWKLAVDEALIVEFENPHSFWMFTNMGSFCNSMDFLYRPVSYTPSRTKIDTDGMIRLVLSHADPGIHNWVDTQCFEAGNLVMRNLMSAVTMDIRTRLVKASALAQELPSNTARVAPAERVLQLKTRFNAIRQRYVL